MYIDHKTKLEVSRSGFSPNVYVLPRALYYYCTVLYIHERVFVWVCDFGGFLEGQSYHDPYQLWGICDPSPIGLSGERKKTRTRYKCGYKTPIQRSSAGVLNSSL